ncbi:unknown protein [Parachlamydia acanthamoebae UV-7]|uniref:Uncharacterized protein n=1 Tax=Parachlamydia acanthamoebae (strain UV7) TaxID=765952 RepID=F8KXS0_PARAV|nr:unknown protein [Parachlamydia acanthamoebae UV-7]
MHAYLIAQDGQSDEALNKNLLFMQS